MREYGILALPASPSSTSNHYEMGWQFTVSEPTTCFGLRVYLPVAQTVVGHLWDSTSTAIGTVTITATANTWCETEFDSPIALQTGVTYTISCYNESNRYYASASALTYNSKVSFISGVYNSSRNAKPTSKETSYIYPFIDVIIGEDKFKTNGTAVFTLSNFAPSGGESLFWDAEVPMGTSLQIYTKVNDGSWRQVSTIAGAIQGLPSSGTCTLYIKAELATTDNTKSPKLTGLSIRSSADKKILILTPSLPNFSSAVGDMTVSYDGLGGLGGTGGPTAAFDGTFTPSGLTWIGHHNDEEHIEGDIEINATLTTISYYDRQAPAEHIEGRISSASVLTNVHDL